MYTDISVKKQTILDIFSGKKQYIIPPYQRSYLWGRQECSELWFDIFSAFENNSEGYFLGSLVLANSHNDRNTLEVIDGQQRLISLTLLIHVLYSVDDQNKDLEEAITIPASRRGQDGRKRVQTNVFIKKDADFLCKALALKQARSSTKPENNFVDNTSYFFTKVGEFKGDIEPFVDFLFSKVWILPIQAEAVDGDEARNNAIEIFETINNRGLNLSDADILKAKLYSKALNDLEHQFFITEWNRLDEECQNLDQTVFNVGKKKTVIIERVFRVYYYMIRAKNEINEPEIGLRTFFSKDYSPFQTLSYQEILDEMFTVVEAVKFFENVVKNPKKYGEISKWFQLINECKNQYPYLAMMVYLFKYVQYGLEISDELICFSKKLVAYVYFNGGETKDIRHKLLSLMIKIYHSNDSDFAYYPDSVEADDFDYFGRLKNGFSLLSFYLQPNQEAIYPYNFSQIVCQKTQWEGHDSTDYAETLGNLLVLDMPMRSNASLDSKATLMKKSDLSSIRELSQKLPTWSYADYQDRDKALRELFCVFFTKPEVNTQ